MRDQSAKNLALSAMFLALGMVLPFFTGQIPQIGKMILPMHIPVMLCGLICGWRYGAVVGFVTPILRSVTFGTPLFYPTALVMAFELMTYGMVTGALYGHSKWKCIRALYKSLIGAMILGRVVKAMVQLVLIGVGYTGYTLQGFVMGAFINALPGIVIQLVLIPTVMLALKRTGTDWYGVKKVHKS